MAVAEGDGAAEASVGLEASVVGVGAAEASSVEEDESDEPVPVVEPSSLVME